MTEADPAERVGLKVRLAAWLFLIVLLVGTAGLVGWVVSTGVDTVSKLELREASVDAVDEAAREEGRALARSIADQLAAPVVAEPPQTEIGPDGRTITHPAWLVQPSGEYPEAALAVGIEGGAVQLECDVLASGEMGACKILSERPAGYSFGEAALDGARAARLSPRNVDGRATDGTVRFATRFVLAE